MLSFLLCALLFTCGSWGGKFACFLFPSLQLLNCRWGSVGEIVQKLHVSLIFCIALGLTIASGVASLFNFRVYGR